MNYLELTIELQPRNPWTEIAVAQLAEQGFESFVETNLGVKAYAQKGTIDVDVAIQQTFLGNSSSEVEVTVSCSEIAHQNWNAKWESDFQPVFVEDKLSILAPFHDTVSTKGLKIIIQPQMSFGTGHHQTTWMMAKALLELQPFPQKVLDMGTGTGVLAILAEKLGAENIFAVDIEEGAVENTQENLERNACKKIKTAYGDVEQISGMQFDTILANINKNILKKHMEKYAAALPKNGILLLSGFFESDVNEIVLFANKFGLNKSFVYSKESWAAIKLIKQ